MNSIYTRWRVLIYMHIGLIISRVVCRAKKKNMFEIEIVRFQENVTRFNWLIWLWYFFLMELYNFLINVQKNINLFTHWKFLDRK